MDVPMSTRPLVDPEVEPILDLLPPIAFDRAALRTPALLAPLRQALIEGIKAGKPPLREDVSVEERHIPGPPGAPDVRVLVYRPKAAATGPRPAILNIHGGGYVILTADTDEPKAAGLAGDCDAVVVSVSYRLAPETPHPGPVEDCYAALAWLHREAAALGIDPTRVAVTGDSAGGGLAAALTLLARDRGLYAIAFQHLVYPMLDDRTGSTVELSPVVGEFVWTREQSRFGWEALLGQAPGAEGVSMYAAPARATDLSRLPPTFIACGALDLFLDENLDYARRLSFAGVPVELHVYPGAPHGFPLAYMSTVARAFQRDSLAAMRRGIASKLAPTGGAL